MSLPPESPIAYPDTPRTHKLSLSKPIVSFSFDDFPRSALVVGGRVLESFGVRATYYCSLRFLEKDTDMGEGFTVADLAHLLTTGHELGCHTFDHSNAQMTSPEAYERSILRNREGIGRLFPGIAMNTFAYPFGAFTPEVAAIAERYSVCCRSTIPGIHSGMVSLNRLMANKLYSRHFSLRIIKNLINQNRRKCGWVIFYSHDVSPNPSSYGCDPRYLEDVVEFSLKSGNLILPIYEAVLEIIGQFSSCLRL